jgi:hypothetical protein
VAFIIVSCSPGGVVATMRELVAAPRSSVAFAGHGVGGLDPEPGVEASDGLASLESQG